MALAVSSCEIVREDDDYIEIIVIGGYANSLYVEELSGGTAYSIFTLEDIFDCGNASVKNKLPINIKTAEVSFLKDNHISTTWDMSIHGGSASSNYPNWGTIIGGDSSEDVGTLIDGGSSSSNYRTIIEDDVSNTPIYVVWG